MAITKSLNSDDSVYVTTYTGRMGRTYEFVCNLKGTQARRVITETDLFTLLTNNDFPLRPDNGWRPVFDG